MCICIEQYIHSQSGLEWIKKWFFLITFFQVTEIFEHFMEMPSLHFLFQNIIFLTEQEKALFCILRVPAKPKE